MNVVYLIICGAGPAMHAVHFVDAARASGWDCHVIATPTGAKFADLDALEAASGHPVTAEHRKPGSPRRDRPSADAVVIAPATANTICKLAAGIADTYALDVASEHIGLGIPTLIVPFANSALTGRVPYRRAATALTDEGVALMEMEEHEPQHGGPLAEKFPWQQAMTQVVKLTETPRTDPEPKDSSWRTSEALVLRRVSQSDLRNHLDLLQLRNPGGHAGQGGRQVGSGCQECSKRISIASPKQFRARLRARCTSSTSSRHHTTRARRFSSSTKSSASTPAQGPGSSLNGSLRAPVSSPGAGFGQGSPSRRL
jgi:hypothetical protein